MPTWLVDPDNPRPSMGDVYSARERLRGIAVRTPLLPLHGSETIWLKPELLQPTGSFKIRGIYNAVAVIGEDARAGGVSNGVARWHDLATLPQRWSAPKFPLRAADFISRGIAEGPALGHVLTLAEDAWLAAGFPLEASALAAIADQTAARFTRDHRL